MSLKMKLMGVVANVDDLCQPERVPNVAHSNSKETHMKVTNKRSSNKLLLANQHLGIAFYKLLGYVGY